ncbi:MAG: hypothetical protein Q9211_006559 [Gyalolechia sp. 1 TL-2023]
MPADDCDVFVCWVGALVLRDKSGGANDVESGHTEEPTRVVDSFRFEDFSADWDRGVDLYWSAEKIYGIQCISFPSSGTVPTVASHSGFPRDTSWDENDLCPSQAFLQTIGIWLIACNDTLRVYMTNIGGDTCIHMSFEVSG